MSYMDSLTKDKVDSNIDFKPIKVKKIKDNKKKIIKSKSIKLDKFAEIYKNNLVLDSNRKTKTLKQMMLEAGYSENSTKAPSLYTRKPAFIAKTKDFIDKIKEMREKQLYYMQKKMPKAKYADLNKSMKDGYMIERLATGQSTENIASINRFDIPNEDSQEQEECKNGEKET